MDEEGKPFFPNTVGFIVNPVPRPLEFLHSRRVGTLTPGRNWWHHAILIDFAHWVTSLEPSGRKHLPSSRCKVYIQWHQAHLRCCAPTA